MIVKCMAYPSLALIKYWGKKNKKFNIPATSSLAVTVDEIYSKTELSLGTKDEISLNGKKIFLSDREKMFFAYARRLLKEKKVKFKINSTNNFPTGAGCASSSSGFASIAACILKYFDKYNDSLACDLARMGSISAARAIYGGFTILKAGSKKVIVLKDQNHFSKLRIIFIIIDHNEKTISSRLAMEFCSKNSDFYAAWIKSSKVIFKNACESFSRGDFVGLGENIVRSYQNMFSVMLSSSIMYFENDTIGVLKMIRLLRERGLYVYETMDAGPQVKVICLNEDIEFILSSLKQKFPNLSYIVSKIGRGIEWI